MFLELKKKVERDSADAKFAMQQRAIDEARVAHALEMGGALRRGREAESAAVAHAMIADGPEKSTVCRILKVSAEELERMLG